MGLQGQYGVLPTGKWFSAAVNIHQPQSHSRLQTHTHRLATQPHTHSHENTDVPGSTTHKVVNNRKWYVAEKVSAQLDSANNPLFFQSSFIFSVHVDKSSIFCARPEVFPPSKSYLCDPCLWLCIFSLFTLQLFPLTVKPFSVLSLLEMWKDKHFQLSLNWLKAPRFHKVPEFIWVIKKIEDNLQVLYRGLRQKKAQSNILGG